MASTVMMLSPHSSLLLLLFASAVRSAPCGAPPSPPYPPVAALPNCSDFPDPWLRADGTRVASAAAWHSAHRRDTLALLENYMYGHAPPQPPVRSTLTGSARVSEYCERASSRCKNVSADHCVLRCLPLATTHTLRNYTLRVGPSAAATWPFDVSVYAPATATAAPAATAATAASAAAAAPAPFVVYNGEGFYSGVEYGDLTAEGAKELLDRGFGLALFDRNQLRADAKTAGGCGAPGCSMGAPDGVQTLYPAFDDWSTISVWAWGAAHVLDFLLGDAVLAPLVDAGKLMSMGHSRGGKTALWHGAQDERVAITFPLMSGTSGNGAIRVRTPATAGQDGNSQSVLNINDEFPYWFSATYHNFSRGEDAATDALGGSGAPWDQHFQRALVAPRAQFGVEGLGNEHENPVGSQATYLAAKEVYDWLGAGERIGSMWHRCGHPMNDNTTRCDGSGEHDWRTVADFAQFIFDGKRPADAGLFNTTAYPIERPYSWKAPH